MLPVTKVNPKYFQVPQDRVFNSISRYPAYHYIVCPVLIVLTSWTFLDMYLFLPFSYPHLNGMLGSYILALASKSTLNKFTDPNIGSGRTKRGRLTYFLIYYLWEGGGGKKCEVL